MNERRFSDADLQHYRDVEQLMHMDFSNHTLVFPSSEAKFWQTTYLLYYAEVTEDRAPTAVCSWQNYKDEVHWPSSHNRKRGRPFQICSGARQTSRISGLEQRSFAPAMTKTGILIKPRDSTANKNQ